MTDIHVELGQDGFLWGLSNSDDSGGCCGARQKPPTPPPPPPLEAEKSAAAKVVPNRKRNKNGKDGCSNGSESPDHEIHIWTERERRKRMRNMFSNLHALLPQLPPKADKSTIVDEAVNYIKTLQHTLQKLQKQKLEKLQSSASTASLAFDPSISSPAPLIAPNQTQLVVPADSYTRESFLADQISSDPNQNQSSFLCNASPVAFQTWTSSNVVLNIYDNEAQFSVCCPKNKLGFFTTVCYVLEKYKIEIVSAHISSDFNRNVYMIQARANMSCDTQMVDAFGTDEMFKQAARDIMLYMST